MRIDWNKAIKLSAWATIIFMMCCGLVMVVWEIHPFFLDEWAIIYNVKYRPHSALWGQTEKMQQFPRVYLQLVKLFSSAFEYSYTSLRLPSFLTHCFGMLYCIYLSGKLFKEQTLYRWLWVLIYVAYPTSVFYFVLTKQYTMEMLMALVGIAQLVLLININKGKQIATGKYIALCLSFIIAPLFSYTYPMVAAPIFGIVLINSFSGGKNLAKQWLPMAFCTAGILVLYFLDIVEVMRDQGMKNYWKDYYMSNGFNARELLQNIYMYFYLFGRGPFMHVLGIIGVGAWLFSTYKSIGILGKKEKSTLEWLVCYSAALMWLSVALFIAGKLPLNAHRLNAYKTPATGIMIIYCFMQLQVSHLFRKPVYAIAGILFLLQIVFIVQPLIRSFTEAPHHRKMLIYNNGKTAIATAQQSAEPMPVFTTAMTLYPHEKVDKADWVIKCYPLYNVKTGVPVYAIDTGEEADSLLHTLPYSSAVVTTGDLVFIIEK